jgi:hypothetical protein
LQQVFVTSPNFDRISFELRANSGSGGLWRCGYVLGWGRILYIFAEFRAGLRPGRISGRFLRGRGGFLGRWGEFGGFWGGGAGAVLGPGRFFWGFGARALGRGRWGRGRARAVGPGRWAGAVGPVLWIPGHARNDGEFVRGPGGGAGPGQGRWGRGGSLDSGTSPE